MIKEWNFNGFISWSPDGKKLIFDETYTNQSKRRLRLVKLKNYKPDDIKFANNFNGSVPYAKSISETLDLRLNFTKNIIIDGKSGNLEILHEGNNVEITYNNYSEDNEIFYNGTYHYEKFSRENYVIFEVDIKSEGKKQGYCKYRLGLNSATGFIEFDKDAEGKDKSYGDCDYDGKKINVENYKL